MRVVMFQDRFVWHILHGRKTQTIRKTALCKAGDTMSLRRWTGKPSRSKQEVFAVAVCESVAPITVYSSRIELDGKLVDPDAMARADGFVDFGEMLLWFGLTHGLPLDGWLIKWHSPQEARNDSPMQR
jgi:hypothetical protein